MASDQQATPSATQVTAQLEATPADPSTMAAQLKSNPMDPNAPLPDPIVTTSRLLIRPMHPQDNVSMQRGSAPASITKYMTYRFAHPYTIEHANTWIKMNLTDNLPNWVICEKEHPDVMIGGIGFKPGEDVYLHTAETGYWIAEPWWGKGYATEALVAIHEYAFNGGRWKRLWAGVFSGNDVSMRCLVKCGYKAEGIMREHIEKNGQLHDYHLYGLTKADWEEWKEKKQKEQK